MNAAGIAAIRGELGHFERQLDTARGAVEMYGLEFENAQKHLDDVESHIRELRAALAEAEGEA